MITDQQFTNVVRSILGVNLDRDQLQAIHARPSDCLFIVAGPGSGKTTVLALRALKFIFVDGIEPSSMVATTFTRKAAKELRSRILGWGDRLRVALLWSPLLSPSGQQRLRSLDFNAIVTGTLDSIAETVLAECRQPGTQPPVVIEEFVSRALMLRQGLFPQRRDQNCDLRDYVALLRGSRYALTAPELSDIALRVRERFLHDSVNTAAYRHHVASCPVCQHHPHPGVAVLCDVIQDYGNAISAQGVLDFAGLEQHFLDGLISGHLDKFASRLHTILVDEYQDTNWLQEQIYFELASRAIKNGGGITVVGDDDQSLFRFRGATVDLFQAFLNRAQQQLHVVPRIVFLTANYRSSQQIVDFCNSFASLDRGYQAARVVGKPPITCARNTPHNAPIIGLFRDSVRDLAKHLADLIYQVFSGGGVPIPGIGMVKPGPGGGVGDCALLCHSPREIASRGRHRLPLLLRQELAKYNIGVFNPRGQDLAYVPDVERLCGLMLECIDPQSMVQNSIASLPPEAATIFDRWRDNAQNYMATLPSLKQFVAAWQQRQPHTRSSVWPGEIHLANLAYKLVTWIPAMQDDIEGLVYLEVVLRTITESARFSNYGGHIIFRLDDEARSIRSALQDVFLPLAMGAVEVEEDLLETLPRDRLNILSIHQAKGLEFPMVIVDVGSDYRQSHPAQERFRFPTRGDLTHSLEDELRQFSPLSPSSRSPRDRAFDDLTRLYFVAFSRARDILVLAGLNGVKDGIKNVATGWDRSGNWRWGQGLPNLVHI